MGSNKIFDLEKIKSCADNLESLGPDTEPEFLQIGKTLNEFANICFSMTDDALKLVSMSNFKDGEASSGEEPFIDETKIIFTDVASHVKQTISSLNEGESLLVDLLEKVKEIREPVQALYSIGKTFRILGIGIKVESSRNSLASQGFDLIAREVADTASLVQDNCRFCNDKALLIEKNIFASNTAIHNNDNTYDERGEKAIQSILNTLEDVGTRSELLAGGIQERSSFMVQGISDVVMAMQFHDISRQQLENIARSLRDTNGKLSSVDKDINNEGEERIALEVYGILTIQVAHLNSVYEQVRHAHTQIRNGLLTTMEQAEMQAEDARTLLNIEGHKNNDSIVYRLEGEIDNIVVSLNKSLDVVKQAAKSSKDVYANVSEIGQFINKIEEIAFDVKVLAINAMVEAIKTGHAGATLSVLAKELSSLSQETRSGATHSIEKLKGIMDKTEEQLEFSNNLSRNMEEVDSMIERAKALTATIMTHMQQINKLAQHMDSASQSLASKITRLIPGIKFPEVMGDRIAENWMTVCKCIDQIEGEYPNFLENNDEFKKMIEQLSQQYVMDRERSIHSQVAGGGADLADDSNDTDLFADDDFELFDDSPQQESDGDDRNKNRDEYGDNVELF